MLVSGKRDGARAGQGCWAVSPRDVALVVPLRCVLERCARRAATVTRPSPLHPPRRFQASLRIVYSRSDPCGSDILVLVEGEALVRGLRRGCRTSCPNTTRSVGAAQVRRLDADAAHGGAPGPRRGSLGEILPLGAAGGHAELRRGLRGALAAWMRLRSPSSDRRRRPWDRRFPEIMMRPTPSARWDTREFPSCSAWKRKFRPRRPGQAVQCQRCAWAGGRGYERAHVDATYCTQHALHARLVGAPCRRVLVHPGRDANAAAVPLPISTCVAAARAGGETVVVCDPPPTPARSPSPPQHLFLPRRGDHRRGGRLPLGGQAWHGAPRGPCAGRDGGAWPACARV